MTPSERRIRRIAGGLIVAIILSCGWLPLLWVFYVGPFPADCARGKEIFRESQQARQELIARGIRPSSQSAYHAVARERAIEACKDARYDPLAWFGLR